MGLKQDIIAMAAKWDLEITPAIRNAVAVEIQKLRDDLPDATKSDIFRIILNNIPVHPGLRDELSQYLLNAGITKY